MKAILSMDSYNRGYNQSIQLAGTSIGNATIIKDSESLGTNASNQRLDESVGFYAIAYNYNGSKVISYRGTDDFDGAADLFTSKDAAYGWILGGGSTTSSQGKMAVQFYKDVAGVGTDPRTADISLTGHSLGGGLAGYVGALYNKNAVLYDSMGYQAAAVGTYNQTNTGADPALKTLVYGTLTPWSTNSSGVNAFNVKGEILHSTFVRQSPSSELDLGSNVTGIGSVQLHSMATMVIRMFFADQDFTPQAGTWDAAAKYFWPVLYDNGFAQSIGVGTVAGTLLDDHKYSDILRQIIAYSAIDEGERPFGDTGIQALYNDANDLGRVASMVSQIPLAAVAKVFVEYAGTLALNKKLESSDASVINGVLKYDEIKHALSVDLSTATWQKAGDTAINSLAGLIQPLLPAANYPLTTYLNLFWGNPSYSIFERAVFATYNVETHELTTASAADKAVLFVAADNFNTVIGSAGKEMLLGGKGGDTLSGGAGIDIVLGNGGNDMIRQAGTASLGLDGDKLDGGEGKDTVSYSELSGMGVVATILSDGSGNIQGWNGSATVGTSKDTLTSIEAIEGTGAADRFQGGNGKVVFLGGAGGDTYVFTGGNDVRLYERGGDSGTDVILFSGAAPGNTIGTKGAGGIWVTPDPAHPGFAYSFLIPNGIENVNSYKAEEFIDELAPSPTGLVDLFRTAVARDSGSPLVLDMDGDGIELTAMNAPGSVYFDMDMDGFKEATGWITGGDALLVTDRNSNGAIDNRNELFGNDATYANGFLNLKSFDSNGDNKITSADSNWSKLKVWIDANADGVSQTAELYTLASKNITSINLAYADVNYAIAGNNVRQESTATIGGANRKIVDAWLSYDNANTIYAGDYTLDSKILFLPNLRGYGNLPDLHVAMSLDPVLLEMVEDLAQTDTFVHMDDLNNKITEILFRWANVDDVSPSGRGAFDAQKLGFLESFLGEYFRNSPYSIVNGLGTSELQSCWDNAFSHLAARIAVQLNLNSAIITDVAKYNSLTDSLTGQYKANISGIEDLIHNPALTTLERLGAAVDVVKYINQTIGMINISAAERAQLDILVKAIMPGQPGLSLAMVEAGFPGTVGDDLMVGTSGYDYLTGNSGNDFFMSGPSGGTYNDSMWGGAGNDTYLHEMGDGIDVIHEESGVDTLLMGQGFAFADIAYDVYTSNLIIYFQDTQDFLIQDYFKSAGTVELIKFVSDGITYALPAPVLGTAANDTLRGTAADNIFSGAGGSDTFIYDGGKDIILDKDTILNDSASTTDVIVLPAGITLANITATVMGKDFLLEFSGGGSIKILNQFPSAGVLAIEKIRFANGSEVLINELTSGINGTAGNDSINGTDGNDVLYGLNGNDSLRGGLGNDIINGGAGVDRMWGGVGDDVYIFRAGDGSLTQPDEINENIGEGIDTIKLTGGILPQDVYINVNSWGKLEIQYSATDKITAQGWTPMDSSGISHGTGHSIEKISFDNGVIWDLTAGLILNDTDDAHDIYGSNFKDIIDGRGGNDLIDGGDENDQITGGSGNDKIYGGKGDDILKGAAGADFISGQEGNDNITGDAENDTIYGDAGSDTLNGGDGNDEINGLSGLFSNDNGIADHDVIEGGKGTDTLYGSWGDDIYVFRPGDSIAATPDVINEVVNQGTDTIKLTGGILSSDVRFTKVSYDYWYSLKFGADEIRIVNYISTPSGPMSSTNTLAVEKIIFDDGSTLNLASILNATPPAAYTPTSGNDTINASAAASAVTINLLAGNDIFTGSNFNDNVIAGDGNDTIEGRGGNDTLTGGNGTDTVTFASAATAVTVNLAATAAQNTIGAGTDTISTFENLTGSAFNDTLTGDSANNRIDGGNGNDRIQGGLGNDVLIGGAGTDMVTFAGATAAVTVNLATTAAQNTVGAGTDTLSTFENLTGSAFNDTLTGDSNANIIDGGNGNDTIQGGLGNDTLMGGSGIDTVTFASATAAVMISLATTAAQNTVGAGTDIITAFENLTGSNFNDTLTGDANANTINGGNGNDLIQGGLGNDVLIGGAGVDTVTFAAATAAVTVNLATTAAQNTIGAGTDTITTFEKLTGSAFNDTLTGDAAANTIDGGNGNDLIQGGLGNDILIGGAGIDTVTFAAATAAVTVNLAAAAAQNTVSAGTDTISGFENLAGSAFNDTLTGDANANTIDGGSGNDLLRGGAGADRLIGGAGIDTADYSASTAKVTIDLQNGTALDGDAQGDILTLIENIMGSNATGATQRDTLYGDANANVIYGMNGDDFLEGGAGADTLDGGAGWDTLRYTRSTAGVVVNLETNINTGGHAQGDLAYNFEGVLGSNYNDTLTGRAANEVLNGAAGNDLINGGDGNDELAGGAGNDTLNGGNGVDIATYIGAASAVTVSLAVTAAQNTLGDGTDTLSNIESLTGSGFNDTLTGSTLANIIKGGNGNDTIRAGVGNDTLYGDAGADTLYGETGADIFKFDSASLGAIDTIKDFKTSENDKLDFKNILSGYDPVTNAITDFIQITTSGTSSIVKIDANGLIGGTAWTQIATLENAIGLTDELALKNSGHIVV
jgi:Ca2+-binding RTX toxin-like protein